MNEIEIITGPQVIDAAHVSPPITGYYKDMTRAEREAEYAEIDAARTRREIASLLTEISANYALSPENKEATLKNWCEEFGDYTAEALTAGKRQLFREYESYGKFPQIKHFIEALRAARIPEPADAWAPSHTWRNLLIKAAAQEQPHRNGVAR
jgi:hypothetical protein